MSAEIEYPQNPQLRLTRIYEDLYWPRYEPSEEQRVQNVQLVIGLVFWTSLVGVSMDCLHVRWLAPLAGLLVAGNGYLRLRDEAQDEPPPGFVRRPPLLGPMASAVCVAVVVPILALLAPHLRSAVYFFLIAFLWLCHFSAVVTKHYVWYLTADSLLTAKTEATWRRDFLRSSPLFFRRQFLPYRRAVYGGASSAAVVFLLLLLCPGIESMLDAWLCLVAFILCYGFLAAVREQRRWASLSLTWFALQTYLNSPPPVGADHPSWSSQGGDEPTQWRQTHFVATVVLLTGLLAPISAELVLSIRTGHMHPSLSSGLTSLSSVARQVMEQPAASVTTLMAVVLLNSVLASTFFLLAVHALCGTTLHAVQQTLSED